MRRTLQSAFPEDRIVSEEEGQSGADGDFEWWCDPVDGTRNFIHGIPLFCIAFGITYRGSPVGGVVHVPAIGQGGTTYHAIVGAGAFKNQNPIRVSSIDVIERAVVAPCLPYHRKDIIGDIVGDIFAVLYYNRHAQWAYLWKLMPWMIIGVLVGVWYGKDLPEEQFKSGMAVLILVSVVLMWFLDRVKRIQIPDNRLFAAIMGLVSGFVVNHIKSSLDF